MHDFHIKSDRVPFRELVLWVTTDCNLRCRYCYADDGSGPRYMDEEVAVRALEIMAASGNGFTVQFAGGEPLLNIELVERLVRRYGRHGIRFQLQTNGTLIDAPMAVKLKELDIALGISLDGVLAVNDRMRIDRSGRGSALQAVNGLLNLRAAGINAGLTCVLTEQNLAGLPDLAVFASYLGNVGGISFDFIRRTGRAASGNVGQPDPAAAGCYVGEALLKAEELADAGGKRITFREVERMRHLIETGRARKYRCYFAAGQLLMVKPDGEAYPCPSLAGFPEFRLGNVTDPDFTTGLDTAVQEMRGRIPVFESCRKCADSNLCGGPCPA